ncbi:MAG: ATPase [Clostridium argentinense]|uniref:ATPase n=1 Tax=Clostridium faecium TaxID=2762223 RepID=A0ABR8YR79_9CLOT|nr:MULTISPECIES: BadF/BadG/BcrA/BcrD ATPase family protein [Clostridium]MBD8046729.1 ATPase [Clostridium faecium]MBS5825378.1 ATPase [Clostridium argentinense]
MKFLGVDGGGTKTEFIIINENGQVLGHSIMPTCHYKQTSLETFEKIMYEGIEEVCSKADICRLDIDFSVIGIAGYGEISEDIDTIEKVVESILPKDGYKGVNDGVVAWAGSLACNPGINIVAGTGAIGYGVDCKGNTARAGGWGHFCGDEGSAFWLGRKVIEIFTKEADGRLEKTPLYYILRNEFDIDNDFELLDIVINKMEMKREKVGKLAKLLYKAAEKDDKVAVEIYSQAAFELYLTIKSIIDKLNFLPEEKVLVSYSGGVFNGGKYILNPLKEYLSSGNKDIKLITPLLKPVCGAALYALTIKMGKQSIDIVENIKSEELKGKVD